MDPCVQCRGISRMCFTKRINFIGTDQPHTIEYSKMRYFVQAILRSKILRLRIKGFGGLRMQMLARFLSIGVLMFSANGFAEWKLIFDTPNLKRWVHSNREYPLQLFEREIRGNTVDVRVGYKDGNSCRMLAPYPITCTNEGLVHYSEPVGLVAYPSSFFSDNYDATYFSSKGLEVPF